MMRNAVTWLLLICMLAAAPVIAGGSGSVMDSKHNLSRSSKGNIKSPTETRVCIFCHGSHNASSEGPLWNHQTTTAPVFTTYQRASMKGSPEQPNGATKLCLSCHDGTVAVGAVRGLSSPIPMENVGAGGEIPASKSSHLGLDLSGMHPVSIKYEQRQALASSSLRWPPVDPENEVGPDAAGYVQCTSCHDPHNDSRSERYPFWRKATFDEVCTTCHEF